MGPVGEKKRKKVRYGDSEKKVFEKRTVRTQEHGAVIPFILFSSPFFLFLSFLSYSSRKKKNPNSRKI